MDSVRSTHCAPCGYLGTVNAHIIGGPGLVNYRIVNITVEANPGGFVTTWQTTAPGESITIPVGGTLGTYAVEWGDGTAYAGVSGDQTHSYDTPGNYTVRIYGDFAKIYLNNDTNAKKLLSIGPVGATCGGSPWTRRSRAPRT